MNKSQKKALKNVAGFWGIMGIIMMFAGAVSALVTFVSPYWGSLLLIPVFLALCSFVVYQESLPKSMRWK
jgi:hypothetical protein